jgi:steroid delta-isomerase-like uncharacterized protein
MAQQSNNETVVRRMFDEAWNRGNLSVVDEILAPDYQCTGPMDTFRGAKGMKDAITKYRTAFPDCKVKIEEIFATPDRVAVRYSYTGTHKGELNGIAPTGRTVTGEGITLIHFRDGRASSEHNISDSLGMLQQLGVVTLPGKARGVGA